MEGKPEYVVIIGGGTKNRLLCRMVADATGMEVVLGPAEAAVIGNIGMQAIAAGVVDSIDEYQSILHGSFQYERIKPENTSVWEQNNNFGR